ncbi:flagellar biosynthesis anti-sigma factor FlgM [Bordetella sp. FB-8]|uniref:flagellar biosynthesis anti-sigma factor FlgM n=1 Tax=Bordetella sp. FB-8 TaxID=1159870 RepID=UPI00037DDF0E|nr:flagellar biosynthesis anti-sigma factor FlgM [Bordetella sp. FB-8]
MKITNTTAATPAGVVTRTDAARTSGGNGTESATPAGSSSQVDLSPASQQLLALQNNHNDINTQRVQTIRDAIASGQYTVDPSRITDGLIASIQELLK